MSLSVQQERFVGAEGASLRDFHIKATLQWVSQVIGILSLIVGVVVLGGWAFDVALLKSVVPGLATMKANTALSFAFAGASLWCARSGRARREPIYGVLIAVLVMLIGLLTLYEYASGADLGIDQFILQGDPSDSGFPRGRMALATALSFVLLGTALVIANTDRARRFGQPLVLGSALLSILTLIGYLYKVQSLYGNIYFSSVALHTAVLFIALSLGVLFARPEQGIMAIVSSDTNGGILVRRLLPASVVLLATLGWAKLAGQRAGGYDTEFGLALFVVTTIVILASMILWVGRAISRVDASRRAAEESLRASEERYRLLFESNPHPMWVYDVETLAFLAVNDAAIAHYGYSEDEFLSMTILDIRPPEEVQTVVEAVRALSPDATVSAFRKHRKKDGTVIDVQGDSREVIIDGRRARLVLATDITDRKRLENQFLHAQKMESVGRLAGGIAHDFNNLLTAIIGYSELLLTEVHLNKDNMDKVEAIRTAGNRAATLTSQLLAFSRKQVIQPRVVDLNGVLVNISEMLRRLIGEDIDLVVAAPDGLGRIKADVGQIEQILLNLAVNARDAMPDGGKLTIETGNVTVDQPYVRTHAEIPIGRYVLLAVSDTGIGMDAETQSHAFEPFFTTKDPGQGTGLGLSTVYGIVRQSEGYIWLYSEPGHGATFKIYFPRIDDVAEPADAITSPLPVRRGHETILLVEDDEAVRRLARIALEGYGYTVLEAASGPDAVSRFRRSPGAVDMVITDAIMPEMSGAELAVELRRLRNDVKILFVSGYTESAIIHRGVLNEGVAFLHKPFSPSGLALKVRQVIDGAG